MTEQRYFVGIVPDRKTSDQIRALQEQVAKAFQSSHALRAPPHITLFPPFAFSPDRLATLTATLSSLAQSFPALELHLDGFGHFGENVIYANVTNSDSLLDLRCALFHQLDSVVGLRNSDQHRFHAHISIASRDLTLGQFDPAWRYVGQQPMQTSFRLEGLTLFQRSHDGWNTLRHFPVGQ